VKILLVQPAKGAGSLLGDDEYADLIAHAMTPRRSVAYLRKFRLREIPGLLGQASRLLGQIRGAYRDHAAP
jgi:hypothetical protein